MTPSEELGEYAVLDGTEWGETMLLLCQLERYSNYISTELYEMVKKEIETSLRNTKENAIIVEETETYTRTIKSLEWHE